MPAFRLEAGYTTLDEQVRNPCSCFAICTVALGVIDLDVGLASSCWFSSLDQSAIPIYMLASSSSSYVPTDRRSVW